MLKLFKSTDVFQYYQAEYYIRKHNSVLNNHTRNLLNWLNMCGVSDLGHKDGHTPQH